MPGNEYAESIAITIWHSTYKYKVVEWLYQSIWGLNSANQDILKITGWFSLGTTQN